MSNDRNSFQVEILDVNFRAVDADRLDKADRIVLEGYTDSQYLSFAVYEDGNRNYQVMDHESVDDLIVALTYWRDHVDLNRPVKAPISRSDMDWIRADE